MEDTLHRKVLVGKNTIEFFSSVEGVAESFPIQSAKDVSQVLSNLAVTAIFLDDLKDD